MKLDVVIVMKLKDKLGGTNGNFWTT